MDIFSEATRKAAHDLVVVAENHYHLAIKGGLIGMNLLRTGKGYKISHEEARRIFFTMWNACDWSSRTAVLEIIPFIIRAYQLVPQNLLHDKLDTALLKDGFRIRNGELRRIVDSRSSQAQSLQ